MLLENATTVANFPFAVFLLAALLQGNFCV